ncbi:MAG TPA: protein phosphatase 2C domain-containing protein [Gemmatimonadales bacterium]|nr:protein phosphatase 2C domain-containing protein [Gemmatimonadales bacterium]
MPRGDHLESLENGEMTSSTATVINPATARKPRDEEVDVYGLTHPGLVRKENQDHFAICALQKLLVVVNTSLPDPGVLNEGSERLAFLAMVADGVGGGLKGEEASRLALERVTRYVTDAVRAFQTSDVTDDSAFLERLQEAAHHSHEDLRRHSEDDPDRVGMATTLTLWIGIWPRGYLLQVGDSRCYLLRRGMLTQVSRDQTMAQDLIDAGVLTRADAQNSRLSHLLSSSIGGKQSAPVVTRMLSEWDSVGMLCSDGLTGHVSDERIRERLLSMTSAKQACEALLQDALDGGGHDNITIIIGRPVRRTG